MKEKVFDLHYLSEHRKNLLGLATILVVIYHFKGTSTFYTFLRPFSELCMVGVDIFLILSAIGLHYSLSKNENIIDFYKRRVVRILPALFITDILWIVICYLFHPDSFHILSILGLDFLWSGNRYHWYFKFILILYMIYPFIYQAEKKYGKWIYLLFILFSLLMNVGIHKLIPVLYENINLGLRRVPIFLVGSYLADFVQTRKTFDMKYLYGSIVLFIFSTLYLTQRDSSLFGLLYMYIEAIQAVSLLFILSFLKIECSLLQRIGVYSMEVYLWFEKCQEMCNYISITNDLLRFALILCMTIGISTILKKVTERI